MLLIIYFYKDIDKNSDIAISQLENEKLDALNTKMDTMYSYLQRVESKVNSTNSFLTANLVSSICDEEMNEEQKVLAICKWVSENISNREYDWDKLASVYNDTYGWLSSRSGLCGARAQIAIEMLKYINVEAYQMNLYDFPDASLGHSCIEAYWDNKWHYIDVTWAGYFTYQGEILSFDEILREPQLAVEGMNVWEPKLDKGTLEEDSLYDSLMKKYYTVENLQGFRSYGKKDKETVVFVYPKVDMGKNSAIKIGELDGSSEDVRTDGMKFNLSQYLPYGLSQPSTDVNIQTEWTFVNCEKNVPYYIKYNIYSSGNNGSAKFYVESENAQVVEGKEFEIPTSYKGERMDNFDGEIIIKFIPEQSQCVIRIRFDNTDIGCGADIDSILIEKGKVQ